MKLLIFSLLLCLGASLKGQTSTDQTVCSLPNTTATGHWACPNALIASNNCFCRPDPAIPAASKLRHKRTFNSIAISPKFTEDSFTPPLPVDVPAIQEKQGPIVFCRSTEEDALKYASKFILEGRHMVRNFVDDIGCLDSQKSWLIESRELFTCPDPHNYALLTSVDGEIHTCHRISQ